jgi:hypothetical protein
MTYDTTHMASLEQRLICCKQKRSFFTTYSKLPEKFQTPDRSDRAMKAPASFFGSFLVAVIRSRSFPNPATAWSTFSSTHMTGKSCSKLSTGVTFGARRTLSSHDSGEMKQPSLYEVLVRKLYMTNMFNPVKLGLKNMEELHNLMNKPMDRVSSILWFVSMSPPPPPSPSTPCI